MNEILHFLGVCPDHYNHINIMDILGGLMGIELSYFINFVKIYFLNLIKCIKNNC